jgi:hypothetical protein
LGTGTGSECAFCALGLKNQSEPVSFPCRSDFNALLVRNGPSAWSSGAQPERIAALRSPRFGARTPGEGVEMRPGDLGLHELLQEQSGGDRAAKGVSPALEKSAMSEANSSS